MSEPMSDERLAELRQLVDAAENDGYTITPWLLGEALAEVDRLRAALARVKALHKPYTYGNGNTTCDLCDRQHAADDTYPCPTIRALEGATDE